MHRPSYPMLHAEKCRVLPICNCEKLGMGLGTKLQMYHVPPSFDLYCKLGRWTGPAKIVPNWAVLGSKLPWWTADSQPGCLLQQSHVRSITNHFLCCWLCYNHVSPAYITNLVYETNTVCNTETQNQKKQYSQLSRKRYFFLSSHLLVG